MQNEVMERTSSRAILAFLLYQLISTVGVIVFSGVLVFGAIGLLRMIMPSAPRASWLLTEIPGFPVQFLVGMGFGFYLRKKVHHRSAFWFWVLPSVCFVVGLLVVAHPEASIFSHLIGVSCRPSEHCFDQVLFTLPLVAAFGYTAGVALVWSKSQHEHVDRVEGPAS